MKNEINFNTLKDFKIFDNINEEILTKFHAKMLIKKFKKNSNIIKEGEEGDSFLFLLKGDISISQAITLNTNMQNINDNREKELIRINSKNQNFSFGEVSLLNADKKRTASVKTNSECLIAELKFIDFFNICEKNKEAGYVIMKNIGTIITKQLISSNNRVLKLTTAFSLLIDD